MYKTIYIKLIDSFLQENRNQNTKRICISLIFSLLTSALVNFFYIIVDSVTFIQFLFLKPSFVSCLGYFSIVLKIFLSKANLIRESIKMGTSLEIQRVSKLPSWQETDRPCIGSIPESFTVWSPGSKETERLLSWCKL